MNLEEKSAKLTDLFFGPPKGSDNPKEIQQSLTKAANEVSRKFQKVLTSQSQKILKQAQKAAKKYGVDPLYVQYHFVRPTRYWPNLPPKLKKALEVAQLIVTESGPIPSFGQMAVPPSEMEVAADAALTDLAEWALKKLLPDLRKQYFKIVERAAKPHVRILRRPEENVPPLVDAASQVSGYFKHLVRSGRELSPLRLLMLRALSAF